MSTDPYPRSEIDVVALVKRGWQLFLQDVAKYVGFVVAIAYLPTIFIKGEIWSFVTMVVPIFEGSFIYGLMRILGKEPRFSDAFLIFNRALPLLLARWASLFLVTLGFFLFIIPGIYFSIAYLLVVPLVLDRDFRVWEALESSRQLITRQWFRAFFLMVIVVMINLVGMIPAGLGLLITGPLTTCIVLALYESQFGVAGNLPYGQDAQE